MSPGTQHTARPDGGTHTTKCATTGKNRKNGSARAALARMTAGRPPRNPHHLVPQKLRPRHRDIIWGRKMLRPTGAGALVPSAQA